jgi:hypothetical protein
MAAGEDQRTIGKVGKEVIVADVATDTRFVG